MTLFDQKIHLQQLYPQLFAFWNDLSSEERYNLLAQVASLDPIQLTKQRELLRNPKAAIHQNWQPFLNVAYAGHQQDRLEGQRLIQDGKVACLLLAGGQGSRLRFEGPKGLYPISVIKHKSLFQLCAEKVAAASRQAGRLLPLAIMTSPHNDAATKAFFEQHSYFGLQPEQVAFFCQGMLPFLDESGALFLESPSQIALGPNGNGFCLHELMQSTIGKQWVNQGIEYVNLIYIDNPLADPFDSELIGFQHRQKAEAVIKCVEKLKPEEKVGVLVQEGHQCRVIEYSEMPEEEKMAKDEKGRLKHRWAYIGLFCFSMSFIQRITYEMNLPLHAAWKVAKKVDEMGNSVAPDQPNAWKFEAFIFDLLAFISKWTVIAYPRELCFAPLKNASGMDSPQTVQQALWQRDRQVIQDITGLPAPDFLFELACDFYYPTPELKEKWQGKAIKEGYIEPN